MTLARLEERLHLLDEVERAEMEWLVSRKLEEMRVRVLVWDSDEYTETFRQEVKRRRDGKIKEDRARKTKDRCWCGCLWFLVSDCHDSSSPSNLMKTTQPSCAHLNPTNIFPLIDQAAHHSSQENTELRIFTAHPASLSSGCLLKSSPSAVDPRGSHDQGQDIKRIAK